MLSFLLKNCIGLVFIIIAFNSCKSVEEVDVQKEVKISGIYDLDDNSIRVSVNSDITDFGICYDTLTNPTKEGNFITITSPDTLLITNLRAGKKYFLRSFGVMNDSTYYFDEVIVHTMFNEVVKDIDDNEYPTVKLNDQVWMAADLVVTKFNDGTQIQNRDSSFYAWNTVNDIWNICPQGYHLPNDQEWLELINALGGYEVAGEKLKSTTLTINNGRRFVDEFTGFNIELNGYEYQDSTIFNKNMNAYYWSSSSNGDTISYFNLFDNLPHISINNPIHTNDNKLKTGFKIRVRCVK